VRRRLTRRGTRTAVALLTAGLAACGSSPATGTETRSQTSSVTATQSTSATATQSTSATATQTTSPAPRVSAATAIASTNVLAFDLLRTLGSPASNIVFSPYSIQAALAMADAGAAGRTAAQINRVLHAPGAAALAASNASLSARLAAATVRPRGTPAGDAAQLSVANGLWLQTGFSLAEPFTQTLASGFGATPQATDFRAAAEASRRSINAWVAAHTAQMIKNLMPVGSVTSQTALVLANAIYLKAHWTSEFVPADTRPGSFLTPSGARVTAPFMTHPPTFLSSARRARYLAVELPYLHSDLAMLVVMPTAGTLARFQRAMTPATLAAISKGLRSGQVQLRMPRFHLAMHAQLNGVLASFGMPLAFSDNADFSGITRSVPLKISNVQHGADLKVDEHGTVASAATGISIGPTAAPPSPVTRLSFDHPFLLFLRDGPSGTILFAGRVTNPAQS
jgi:serpin B